MENLKMYNAGFLNLPHHEGIKRAPKMTTYYGLGFPAAILLLLLLLLPGCKKNKVGPDGPEITPTVNVDLPTDPGEVGLVIDAREIFRKGYIATEAVVSFPEFPGFGKTLDIDPVLNVATLHIPNDSLTEAQKAAFAAGITTDIVIRGEGQNLAHYNNKRVLDDTGEPLILETDKKERMPPVMLKENISYYIHPEEIGGDGSFPDGGVLKSYSSVLYDFRLPEANDFHYKYYVKPVGDSANTYYILRADDDPDFTPTFYFSLRAADNVVEVTMDQNKALAFVFEQDVDGWARIRQQGTGKYLSIGEGTGSTDSDWKALSMTGDKSNRFRFISDIAWSMEDRGTVYQQPIMPPSEIEFAYQSTIKNCTPGTLTETVGNAKSRTSKRSMTTSESLELYSSNAGTTGFKVGLEIGGKIGPADVKASGEFHKDWSYTTSSTVSTGSTLSDENEQTSEVSRSRTLEVLPRTGVEVYDAVRVVKNPRIPFTQVLRLKGSYRNGAKLTGAELLTQMLFNLVEGVPAKIGADYIDVSIRGEVLFNEIFETETGAKDVPNACN